MRHRLAVLFVMAAVMIAACGGGSGSGSAAAPTNRPSAAQPGDASAPAGGAVDCVAIATAAQQLLAVQLLAQLRTPDVVASIKAKELGNLDPDAFLAAMHELHALDGYASPLGDPKAAIEVYEEAATAAQVLFATEPVTQAAIDTYNEKVGTVADFLGHQIAISGAIGEAGC